MNKMKFSSPLRITKNIGISKRDTWLIRIGGIVLAFLLVGILCSILKPGTFFDFYAFLVKGSFNSTKRILNVLRDFSFYLLLAVAVTPAFKMKFWNIGAEGQALAGCIVAALTLYFLPKSVPDSLAIIIALIGAVVAGMAFALIPTFFKMKFNTNETLFTLLMNYIATPLALFICAFVDKGGHNMFPQIEDLHPGRVLFDIAGIKYLPIIICAVVITVVMYFYLKKTKQGFELSVLGDSTNTARYVGISRKVVSYRTMAISGAIAGLVGFLLVCCQHGKLSATLVGGRGFTAVLIAWLGYFNPGEIAIYGFLVGFLDYGTQYVAGQPSIGLDPVYFSGLIIGLFIFTVVVIEFFTRYKVKRCLPNEVSEIRDKILNFPDTKINQSILFEEFKSVGYFDFKAELAKEKRNLAKEKPQFTKKIKDIKKELLGKNNLTEKEKDTLTKTLLSLRKEYSAMLKQYKDDKKLLKIKRQCQKTMMKANASRLKTVFKDRISTTLTILKSGSIVYNTKDEVNNFLNSMIYTKWQFNDKATLKNVFAAYKENIKNSHNFDRKLRDNNRVLSSDVSKANEYSFNYCLLSSDFIARNYLERRKIYFSFMVKWINRHNIRLIKKKKKDEIRAQKNKKEKV